MASKTANPAQSQNSTPIADFDLSKLTENLRENTSIATRRQVPFIQVMAIGTNTKNEIDANVQTLWIRDEEGHIPWRFQVKWNSYGNWTIQELKIFAILGHFQSLPQEFQRYR